MELKKSKGADLKNKSFLFLQIGMVTALTIVLAAFQWSTYDKINTEKFTLFFDGDYGEEMIPVTRPEIEPPKPQPQPVAEVFELVEDIVDVPEVEIFSTEASEQTRVEVIPIESEPVDENTNEDFWIVEEMPLFPGDSNALMTAIYKNIVYPQMAIEHQIQGRVFVGFVVNKFGKVDKIKIVRGVDPILDKEAMRVISLLPDWSPGKQRGKPVNVAFVVPINFHLK